MRTFSEKNWNILLGSNENKSNRLFIVGKVRSLPLMVRSQWKFKCPVGVAYLPVLVLWNEISTNPTDIKLGQDETERNGVKTNMKFCSQKVLMSRSLY